MSVMEWIGTVSLGLNLLLVYANVIKGPGKLRDTVREEFTAKIDQVMTNFRGEVAQINQRIESAASLFSRAHDALKDQVHKNEKSILETQRDAAKEFVRRDSFGSVVADLKADLKSGLADLAARIDRRNE